MKTKITIWLEEGKPTKVKTMKANEFYLDDLSKVFEEINRKETMKSNGDEPLQEKKT